LAKALWGCCYRPLASVALSGFVTQEQLTAEQALARNFAPMPTGTRWGAKWEYGWFKGEIVLPPEAAGQRIVLRLDPGSESLVWVNGQIAGAKDSEHDEITLTHSGQPGERHTILLEAYAGTARAYRASAGALWDNHRARAGANTGRRGRQHLWHLARRGLPACCDFRRWPNCAPGLTRSRCARPRSRKA